MRALALIAPIALAASAQPYVEAQPGIARPGDAVRITLKRGARPEGKLGARALNFASYANGFEAITGLPVEQQAGTVPISLRFGNEAESVELGGELEVTAANFRQSELTVAKKYVQPPPSVKKQMAEDRKAFARAFAQKFSPRLFQGDFEWPKLGYVTAPFGDLRVFNGKKQSQHFGTDIDGRIGDPVFAANDGKVVLVRDCYASGKTVIVHHGLSLYTAYFHLSDFAVKEGSKVKRGQKIGLVGKTGRVTGPHLHWGVKVDGMWVDAESLLRIHFD